MSYTIGIDIRMMRNTGIGTYLKGILGAWPAGVSSREACLFGGPGREPLGERFAQAPFYSPIYSVTEQMEYPFRLKQCRLWHSPHYNVPLVKGKTRLVVTIHDLIHWIFRKDFFSPLQAFYAGQMLARAVRFSDHIITVSRKTEGDLIGHFDADPGKISVIYEGVNPAFSVLEDPALKQKVCERHGIRKPYFLYVGMLKPHKGVLWLIHLFRKLKAEGKIDAALVLVGRKDKKYGAEFQELSRLKTEGDLIHINHVESTQDLVALYNGALALVHPSLYEGFGLTLLEAMSCGTPVAACRAASIPEVAGEAAPLVPPAAVGEMRDAMVQLEKSRGLREDLRRKGLLHAKRFSWEKAAKATCDIYEKVLAA